MYRSPIEIIQGKVRMEQENNILRAVYEQDIVVDKHELLRALQYDRGQYEKGFQDGKADATPKWIPVTERLPEKGTRVLVWLRVKIYDHTNMDTDRLLGGRWVRWGKDVTHWMPLPEPPKEDGNG